MCQNSVKHFKCIYLFNTHNTMREGTITISILQMKEWKLRGCVLDQLESDTHGILSEEKLGKIWSKNTFNFWIYIFL